MGHKLSIAFAVALLLFAATGCKQIDKLTMFNLDYESNITYSAGLPINLPFNISTPDMATNSESEFAINDTRKDLIESITLTQVRLTITSPQGKTFSFLKDVRVYISAPNLPEVEIAQKLNIDNSVEGEIQLDMLGAELQEYIKAEKFNLRVASTTDEVLSSQVNVSVYSVFFVDAKILGI